MLSKRVNHFLVSNKLNDKLCNSLNSILFIVRIDYPTLSGRCVVVPNLIHFY